MKSVDRKFYVRGDSRRFAYDDSPQLASRFRFTHQVDDWLEIVELSDTVRRSLLLIW